AVNDSLGHEAGDELLVAVAERLKSAVRPGDTVARMGGDEFAMLLEAVGPPTDVHELPSRILGALELPFSLQGREVFVSGSIGVRLSTSSDTQASALMRDADVAMYAAKSGGKGT